MWFGVAPRTDIEKKCALKKIKLRAQNVITILGSIVNIIGGWGLYDHSMGTRTFYSIMNNIVI